MIHSFLLRCSLSSIHAYYGNLEYPTRLTDTGFILGILADERTEAIKRFREHMKIETQDICLDDVIQKGKLDEEVMAEIEAILGGRPVTVGSLWFCAKPSELLG